MSSLFLQATHLVSVRTSSGSTNTRCRLPPDLPSFLENWSLAAPTQHFALGVGHVAHQIERLARWWGIEYINVTDLNYLGPQFIRKLVTWWRHHPLGTADYFVYNQGMNTMDNPIQMTTLPKVELGSTGLQVSRLSFGTGSNGWQGRSDQSDLGVDKLAGLLQMAYDYGVNFWDTADAYGTHPHIARALQNIPRDKVVILTKTLSRKAKQVSKDIDRFLRELNTDYIDIVLLHMMTLADWPIQYADAMEVLSRAQQAGKVRAVGVSCHSLSALQATVQADWSQVVMARINHTGVNMDASPGKVAPFLEKLYASGRAVYGMKVLGNGRLSGDVGSAIQFALQLGTLHAITIGITSQQQLIENQAYVNHFSMQYPLQDWKNYSVT